MDICQKEGHSRQKEGLVQRSYGMLRCQTISKEAKVAEGKSERKQGQRKEIHRTQTYNKMPYLSNNKKNAS